MTCSANEKDPTHVRVPGLCWCRGCTTPAARKREYGGADVKYDSGENVLGRIVCHRGRSALSPFNDAADYPTRETPTLGGAPGSHRCSRGDMSIFKEAEGFVHTTVAGPLGSFVVHAVSTAWTIVGNLSSALQWPVIAHRTSLASLRGSAATWVALTMNGRWRRRRCCARNLELCRTSVGFALKPMENFHGFARE